MQELGWEAEVCQIAVSRGRKAGGLTLLLAQNPGTVQLLQVSDSIKQKLQMQSQKADRMLLTRALELANQCDFNYKMSNNKRLSVELCLMQINANYVYKLRNARQSQERK